MYNKVKNIMSSNHNVILLGSTTTQSPIITIKFDSSKLRLQTKI